LVIDASIGFEMETFEFLSILKNHGMSACMGVLTHLDYFKDNKELRKTKKQMKMRFWKDVYDGAKLFYLSGVVYERYPKREIHNLARFISVAKLREISWKKTHPYVVADRFDVIQGVKTKGDKAMVSFYGYVRGTYFDKLTNLHLMGIGDYPIATVTRIQDPVPVEARRPNYISKEEFEKDQEKKKKRRTLKDKERIIYAPFSSLGALNFDKTSGYITIPDKYVVFTKTEEGNEIEGNEGQKMVWELQQRKFRETQAEDEEMELVEGVGYKETQPEKPKQQKTSNIRVVER
jgi:ribosome biogenesis protein BMS1